MPISTISFPSWILFFGVNNLPFHLYMYIHSGVYIRKVISMKNVAQKNDFPILSQQRLFNFHTKHFFNIPLSDRNLKWNIFIKKQFFQFQKKNLHSRKKTVMWKRTWCFWCRQGWTTIWVLSCVDDEFLTMLKQTEFRV